MTYFVFAPPGTLEPAAAPMKHVFWALPDLEFFSHEIDGGYRISEATTGRALVSDESGDAATFETRHGAIGGAISWLSDPEKVTNLRKRLASAQEGLELRAGRGERIRPASRRRHETRKESWNGRPVFVTLGTYADGGLAEIFIDTAKEGTEIRELMGAWAMTLSVALQYGVPAGALVRALRGHEEFTLPSIVAKAMAEAGPC